MSCWVYKTILTKQFERRWCGGTQFTLELWWVIFLQVLLGWHKRGVVKRVNKLINDLSAWRKTLRKVAYPTPLQGVTYRSFGFETEMKRVIWMNGMEIRCGFSICTYKSSDSVWIRNSLTIYCLIIKVELLMWQKPKHCIHAWIHLGAKKILHTYRAAVAAVTKVKLKKKMNPHEARFETAELPSCAIILREHDVQHQDIIEDMCTIGWVEIAHKQVLISKNSGKRGTYNDPKKVTIV